jgi:ecotin
MAGNTRGGIKEKAMRKLLSSTALVFFFAALTVHAGDNMKAFPPPEKGMVRYVLHLPKQDDESALKVELIVGKTVLLDERNRYFFSGKIQQETIKGWGFTRYNVSQLGPMAGTRIAVDPNAPKVNRFIALGGEPYLIRYNSRLPVVVYAPEGVEVRYRIWTAEPEMKGFEKG